MIILLVISKTSRANISYRIDDITFEKGQKQVLENALEIAEKYNISFDLAVIAKPFDENADAETLGIYENNRNRFDVVAHGLTHKNPLNYTNSPECEFYDDINDIHVPLEIQEQHIKEMKEIFERHNMTRATEIFIAPRYAYDKNTKELAKKYGYKMIGLSNIVYIPIRERLYGFDIYSRKIHLDILSVFRKNVQINLHPANFENTESVDRLIQSLQKK